MDFTLWAKMYIMEELKYELVETYSIYHEGCEDLWIKLRFVNGESLLVGVLYRHPKSNTHDFAVKLQNSLQKANEENLNCVIMGNVNINVAEDKISDEVGDYLQMLNINAFHNLINQPTRVTATTQTIIDHLQTNAYKFNIVPGIVTSAITDNHPLFVVINHTKLNIKLPNSYIRSLKSFE